MNNPKKLHENALFKIIRFLKNSLGRGIFHSKNHNISIIGYCDFDWATCPITRKLVTRFCLHIGGSLVSWKSKKQKVVSRLSVKQNMRLLQI